MLKKILLAAVIFIFGTSAINHAQMRSPEERAKQLTEQLKLNKEQSKKVEDIFTKQQEKMQNIFQNGGGFGDPATRDKMMKVREETNSEINKLLTDKQKTEYKKIVEEQQKRMQEMRKNRMNQ